ncbi:GET complex subunit get1 [Serendipita sp. 396]|nr:GET complex subunit get1 [Serendipita sp. 396]KAG8870616.1 GET complex subunit get1 [Serendipita sp. 405]
MALAVSILLLVLLTNVLGWIGHAVLLDTAYAFYARLFLSTLVKEQNQLKSSIFETKHEMAQMSAQDEFAKWAKLRRKHDKAISDLEKLNARLSASKSGFSTRFNSLVWIATTGAQFFLVWWYRREPVFYLPSGWFGPFTWFLSLPSAPSGSISGAVWQMACQRVVGMGERLVKDLMEPIPEQAEAVPKADSKAKTS